MPCYNGLGYSQTGGLCFSRVLHGNIIMLRHCKCGHQSLWCLIIIINFFLLQFYSAKMEELVADGVHCMVSFLDFHNSCDIVPLSSLRPFPIIAWVSME